MTKKIITGVNDLATLYPEIASEWHPTKNGDKIPQNTAPKTQKMVWWLGKCGHEWEATIANRTMNRSGCSVCAGRTVVVGINDLSTTNPALASEWHPTKNGTLTPQMVTSGSNKEVWWKCSECGFESKTRIKYRNRKMECRRCVNKKVSHKKVEALIQEKGSLQKNAPELAAEWHPALNGLLTPENVTCGCSKQVWWLGKCGHEWPATVQKRIKGSKCPVCSGETQTSFPEQAVLFYLKKITLAENRRKIEGKEIDVYLPLYKIGIEYNGYWHKGKQQRDEKKKLFFEKLGIRIITIKEGKQNYIDGDVIEYIYSQSEKESLDWAITAVFNLLHVTAPIINVRNDASEIYDQYIFSQKEKSLASKYPEIAAEWHPTKNGSLSPDMVQPSSNKEVWWLGECGHEWPATVANRTIKGTACGVCSGKRIVAGINDLATTNPKLAAEWHPTKNGDLTPQMVSARTSRKRPWWLCSKCGYEWPAQIGSRNNGTGCPACAGKKPKIKKD